MTTLPRILGDLKTLSDFFLNTSEVGKDLCSMSFCEKEK